MSESTIVISEVACDKLRTIVERIESLVEEKREITESIKQVYAEAKAFGYDVAALRTVIAERRKDAHELQEQEAINDLYREVIGNETKRGIPTLNKMPGV